MSSTVRGDIQGLRAVAVLSVFLFHTWPAAAPGGFVGVDVFFVVSGFLITGLLLRELARDGTVHLATFYARRVRRLLPAATLVLVTVVAGAPLLLPSTRWRDLAQDAIASALYVQNWHLASRAVDYLAEDSAPSALQHYWSLSIEEQFYFVWPGLLWGVGRARRPGLAPVLLALVALASFAASVVTTAQLPSIAYFVSHTRVWELALGGLLAATPALARPRPWLALPGLVGIVASIAWIDVETPFPGWIALAPTVATALVLAGDGSGPVARVLGAGPMQWIGDRSYSIYLWHWPVAVVWDAHGGAPGPVEALCVGLMTLALADRSHALVEERFRHAGWLPAPVIGAASLLPVALGTLLFWKVDALKRNKYPIGNASHPGGAALFGAAAPAPAPMLPPPAVARYDRPVRWDCQLGRGESSPKTCVYGDKEGTARVALIGDSHASQWIPAFDPYFRTRATRLELYAKDGCGFVPGVTSYPPDCRRWSDRVLEKVLADPPAAVLLAHVMNGRGGTGDPARVDAEVALWTKLRDAGVRVIAIPDGPRWTGVPAECAELGGVCETALENPGRVDLLPAALARSPWVTALDLRDTYCPGGRCPAVIGNVLVWRDDDHLTASYARSLEAEVARRLGAILGE